MPRLYKVLNADGSCCHGGTGKWPLPNGQPGAWLEVTGDLIPCRNGLHLCRAGDLIHWMGPALWEAEYEGESIRHEDTKTVVRRARLIRRVEAWNDQNLRLFAVDCAERVLDLEEKAGRKVHPRSRSAVGVPRRFADGRAAQEELASASAAAWRSASAWRSAAASAAAAAA